MGFSITALELGPALAEEARRRLSQFARVSVVNAAFEDWRPPADLRFDLVYAATAWKWIDPSSRYQHAADTLRRGGHLAVWAAGHAFPRPFDPFFTEIQPIYDQIGEGQVCWPPPEPTPRNSKPREKWKRLAFSSQSASSRHYLWSCRYDADRYIALLNTFSGHIVMEQSKRKHLYHKIRFLLRQRPDGQLTATGRRHLPSGAALISLGYPKTNSGWNLVAIRRIPSCQSTVVPPMSSCIRVTSVGPPRSACALSSKTGSLPTSEPR